MIYQMTYSFTRMHIYLPDYIDQNAYLFIFCFPNMVKLKVI